MKCIKWQMILYNQPTMRDYLNNLLTDLGLSASFSNFDLFTIAASLILFLAARPLSKWLRPESNTDAGVNMMRTLNFLIVLAILIKAQWADQPNWPTQITNTLIVIYFAVVFTQLINLLIRRRFGKARLNNERTIFSDTYASRGLSLVATITVGIVALVSCLRILGLDSLLEAGGAIGIIGLILAMTQASWAPDIINGLIILNSRLCEESDVIQFNMDGKTVVASVFKTKIFHTELLDLANNHRIMIRNTKLRDYGVHNLSRFASARGLREVLCFNIDYQHDEDEVTEMFQRAFTKINELEDAIQEQYEPEIRVLDTGDYAVTWAVYYYIKEVKSILGIRQLCRSYILAEATSSNISLATPTLQQVDIAGAKPPTPASH